MAHQSMRTRADLVGRCVAAFRRGTLAGRDTCCAVWATSAIRWWGRRVFDGRGTSYFAVRQVLPPGGTLSACAVLPYRRAVVSRLCVSVGLMAKVVGLSVLRRLVVGGLVWVCACVATRSASHGVVWRSFCRLTPFTLRGEAARAC